MSRRTTGWLFTIEEKLDDQVVGESFDLWTEPPYDLVTEDIRLRADGDPYTPAWTTGDEIVVYHPNSGCCVGRLTVESPPSWDAKEAVFDLRTTVSAWNASGPPLADIGVPKALQGGRHRLTDEQFDAARRLLP